MIHGNTKPIGRRISEHNNNYRYYKRKAKKYETLARRELLIVRKLKKKDKL